MPIWAYQFHPFTLFLLVVGGIELLAILGLLLFRRFVIPRIDYHDGVNEAISGTVQAIGVFYGVTVGLIAVGVWTTLSSSSDLVSKEAASLASFYRDVSAFPEPTRSQFRKLVLDYTNEIINVDWPAQRQGRVAEQDSQLLDDMQKLLAEFEPNSEGHKGRYAETMSAFNRVLQCRALRIDAVGGGLSVIMWCVIWCGAAISIGIAYFFHLRDFKLHAALVAMMAGFLALVIYMILINDKPFVGEVCIKADSYILVRDTIMMGKKQTR